MSGLSSPRLARTLARAAAAAAALTKPLPAGARKRLVGSGANTRVTRKVAVITLKMTPSEPASWRVARRPADLKVPATGRVPPRPRGASTWLGMEVTLNGGSFLAVAGGRADRSFHR